MSPISELMASGRRLPSCPWDHLPPCHRAASDPAISAPVAPMMQPPVDMQPPAKKARGSSGGDFRDAFMVALVCFVALMPTVQRILTAQFAMMEDKTSAALITAGLAGAGYYFLKEYLSK